MSTRNAIGLETIQAEELAHQLNDLLSHYSVFYQNVRGFHWNIQGEKFFELHLKFEELYNDLLLKIDEIAERILTLGSSPDHRFSVYAQTSTISESAPISDGITAVEHILAAFQTLLIKQRSLLTLAADAQDEGTQALMSDYIRAQEKMVWMYSAFLQRS